MDLTGLKEKTASFISTKQKEISAFSERMRAERAQKEYDKLKKLEVEEKRSYSEKEVRGRIQAIEQRRKNERLLEEYRKQREIQRRNNLEMKIRSLKQKNEKNLGFGMFGMGSSSSFSQKPNMPSFGFGGSNGKRKKELRWYE